MSEKQTAENQTKKLIMQKIVDGCIIVLLSIIILSIYESDWASVHASKENMFAIHFNMFSLYYNFAAILFMFVVPNFLEFLISKRIMHRYTNEKQIPAKWGRILKIFFLTLFIVLLAVTFTDKYSRIEFYDNGNIIEYNRHNEIENQYNETDIDFIELKTNHSSGKMTTYWTEAVIHAKDNKFSLRSENYITPIEYDIDYETEQSLYGLKKIKENFPDKIKINNKNIDTLLRVESVNYNENQAQELCKIFEVDYDEIKLWLKEEWDIVLESANS